MPSNRRLPPRLALVALVVAALALLWPSTSTAAPSAAPPRQEIPAGYDPVGENESFQLYANRETLAFKVVDKRSGYVWSSTLDEVTDEDDLNRTWTAFATSGLSIDFLDEEADDERASITSADHTIEFKEVDQGFEATLTFTEPSITLVMTVQLEKDGVRVAIPFASIREADPEFRLGQLHLYPFLGATREDSVSGYMFIPDGSGTLIDLRADTKARNMFLGRYYGSDMGMLGSLPFDPNLNRPMPISVPVIGMVHGEGQNGYLAVVEAGASYGEIRAHPAGITTKFNFVYNAFLYNQSYFQATNRSGAGVTVLQPTTNAFDIVVHYRLLTGEASDYVGMARNYQAYLVEKGMISDHLDESADIGIHLEFLGAEKQRILFWDRAIPVTTVGQMGEILDRLAVKNPDVVYYGWQPRGASAMLPPRLALDGSLGSVGQLRALAEEVAAANGQLSLYDDPQAAIQDSGGYSARSDLALAITSVNLGSYTRGKRIFFFNQAAVSERYRALRDTVSKGLGVGLALDGLGSNLYSDFRDDQVVTREAAIQNYRALMGESETPTGFYRPNDYMFPYMRAYYNIPLTDNGYLYTTQVVPFLQVALSGYVPMYGPPLNFSSDLRTDLLRHADYGVYPSYFLTQAPTSTILNTDSGWIFSSSYAQWGEDVGETYAWLNALLAPVKGAQIVAREALGNGVFATTYSNGKQIVVNYGSTPFADGSLIVEPQNAILREVEP